LTLHLILYYSFEAIIGDTQVKKCFAYMRFSSSNHNEASIEGQQRCIEKFYLDQGIAILDYYIYQDFIETLHLHALQIGSSALAYLQLRSLASTRMVLELYS